MPIFVHLAPDSRVNLIRRNGISRMRKPSPGRPGGVFAVPVTRNFYISHQWLRELKRRGEGPISAVYFRIPDDEEVWVGHYAQGHQLTTAAEAAAVFMSNECREGWEVIVPRRIAPQEIRRVRSLPQIVGWRYYPAAKGNPPYCTCRFCTRGQFGSEKLRKRLGSPDD